MFYLLNLCVLGSGMLLLLAKEDKEGTETDAKAAKH